MQTSIFIARLIGPVMIVAGLSVLFDRQRSRSMAEEFLASRALMFLGGMMVMLGGLSIVLHNVWTSDWRVIVTLFRLAAGYLRRDPNHRAAVYMRARARSCAAPLCRSSPAASGSRSAPVLLPSRLFALTRNDPSRTGETP